MAEMCPCGQPLHYTDPKLQEWIQTQVDHYGATQEIRVIGVGAWRVPRHFIALHGFDAKEAERLANQYNFEEILEP